MMYMNTPSSFVSVYSSESTNDTSLIAKSMSWNYSGEVDDAVNRENGGIADINESRPNATKKMAENKAIAERKDSENIADGEDKGTSYKKDNERTADNTDNADNADNANARHPEEADDDRQNSEDHVTGSSTNTCESQETGHVTACKAENQRRGLSQSALAGRRQRKHPAVRAKEDSNLRRTVELDAAQSAKPRGLILHQSEKPHEDGKATVTRCILATSRFIWLPICQPNRGCRHSEVMDEALVTAAECVRWHLRRNALCDHMALPMTQETRERIERDVAERKTSVTRKVSQYLKAAFNSSNYDVDLI